MKEELCTCAEEGIKIHTWDIVTNWVTLKVKRDGYKHTVCGKKWDEGAYKVRMEGEGK